MIPCAEAVRRLWAYLDGDLADRERATVDAHLALCRRCCGELEFARHLQAKLAAAAGPDLPPDIAGRFERLLDDLDGGGGARWTTSAPT